MAAICITQCAVPEGAMVIDRRLLFETLARRTPIGVTSERVKVTGSDLGGWCRRRRQVLRNAIQRNPTRITEGECKPLLVVGFSTRSDRHADQS
jgi:hypothetical protein